MDGLSSESEVQKPAEEQKPEDTKDTKGTAKPKKPRVARKKPEKTLPSAADDVPAAAPVDAVFFGKLGSTLRDLKREARAQKSATSWWLKLLFCCGSKNEQPTTPAALNLPTARAAAAPATVYRATEGLPDESFPRTVEI